MTTPAISNAKPPGGGGGGTRGTTTYAGGAYALDADLTALSSVHVHVGPVADTGQLPATGGFLSNQAVSLHSPAPLCRSAWSADSSRTG
ncbi:MAG: hypothetical protein ABR571_16530 [Jatrophihabitans sp.]|uniref:hypothetical protein n=1 Tax=Jatrophihabitans sp. TaxID=1932789 RepID=UPI00390CF9DC